MSLNENENNENNENREYFQDENLEEFTRSIDASSIFINQNNFSDVYDFVTSDIPEINIPNFFNILYNFNPYLIDDLNNYIANQDVELERTLELSLSESNNIERGIFPLEFSSILYNSIKSDKPKECSICLSDFKDDDSVYVTKCSHIFHYDCIKEWSHYKNDCPMCRDVL